MNEQRFRDGSLRINMCKVKKFRSVQTKRPEARSLLAEAAQGLAASGASHQNDMVSILVGMKKTLLKLLYTLAGLNSVGISFCRY